MDHNSVSRGAPSGPPWQDRTYSFGGRTFDEILVDGLDAVVREMKERFAAELPGYARLPKAEFEGWVDAVCRAFVALFGESLRRRAVPTESELHEVRDTAARRAALDVPMGEVITAFHIGSAVVLDRLTEAADATDLDAVVGVHRFALELLNVIAGVVGTGYALERQSMLGEELAARQALTTDLLDGTATAQAAIRAGLALPTTYFVFDITFGTSEPPAEPGQARELHAPPMEDPIRRAGRLLREEGRRVSPDPVLWEATDTGWIALMPSETPPDALTLGDRLWLNATHKEIQAKTDVPIYTAWAASAPASVPAAARLAREVAEVVRATHRPPGLYELDDVLIDYQLTRPGAARDRLSRMLDPIDDRPDLFRTVATYIGTGRDRRRTAQLMHLHPNSVDNRLRRAADLTGLDATDPDDAILMRAALLGHGGWV